MSSGPVSGGARSNAYVFTWCNPNGVHPFFPDKVDYYIYQLEKAPTTGMLHYQGYVHFKNRVAFSTIQKLLPHARIEPARGTAQESEIYCSKKFTKEGVETYVDGPWTNGKIPAPGTRTDLSKFKEDFLNGMGKRKLVDTHFDVYAKFGSGLERAMKILKPSTYEIQPQENFNWNPDIDWKYCHVIYGPTGLGKTQWAISRFKNPCVVSDINDLLEFDHTENDGIVFDDMSFSHWAPTTRIHLVDTDIDRSIKILYQIVKIPKGTKKIFTNQHNTLFYGGKDNMIMSSLQEGAINRRVSFTEISQSLYV